MIRPEDVASALELLRSPGAAELTMAEATLRLGLGYADGVLALEAAVHFLVHGDDLAPRPDPRVLASAARIRRALLGAEEPPPPSPQSVDDWARGWRDQPAEQVTFVFASATGKTEGPGPVTFARAVGAQLGKTRLTLSLGSDVCADRIELEVDRYSHRRARGKARLSRTEHRRRRRERHR